MKTVIVTYEINFSEQNKLEMSTEYQDTTFTVNKSGLARLSDKDGVMFAALRGWKKITYKELSVIVPPVMRSFSVEDIESIKFHKIGDAPYHLKRVEVSHPARNVFGLIKIGNNYYKKNYT